MTKIQQPYFDEQLDEALTSLLMEYIDTPQIDVYLNIYEMNPSFAWTRILAMGIYHTAIVVIDQAIAFGATEQPGTGVWLQHVDTVDFRLIKQKKLKHQRNLPEIINIVKRLSIEWTGLSYDTLKRNCNNFTQILSTEITGKNQLPWTANNAARTASKFTGMLDYFDKKRIMKELKEQAKTQKIYQTDCDECNWNEYSNESDNNNKIL